ncbi:MAG: SpoIID/LytB domain-containing protein [Candidatus Sericytochromatia bacterium]|nr:SpoIID/LytB domain-containing protein [Candidatus Sericytochromatia bacterium]
MGLALLLLCCLARPGVAAPLPLRVGVLEGVSGTTLASSVEAHVRDARGQEVGRLAPLEGWQASLQRGLVLLRGPRAQQLRLSSGVRIEAASQAGTPLVFAGGRWYRGGLELRVGKGGLVVINRVDLEAYLYGVVPSEMAASWPDAALRCQAVAARSYVLANVGKHGKAGYDVCDTDECQVYKGAGSEVLASNLAVEGTRGVVLMQGGKVLPAFFHASSGGYTENSEDVWLQRLDHIRAVPDYDQDSPHYTWHKNVDAAQLTTRLANRGIRVGGLRDLQPVSRSYSGRVREVRVVGTAATRTISGETLRLAAGLNSTLFNMAPRGEGGGLPTAFVFAGRGWGHGLGMSQWGARRLAQAGYAFSQILSHYYPGASLQRLP